MWLETDDFVYLEEKREQISEALSRINKIRRAIADGRVGSLLRATNGSGKLNRTSMSLKSRFRSRAPRGG